MLVHHVPWSPITKWNPRPKCSAPTVYGVHFIWLLQPKGQCTCRIDDAYITGFHFNEAYTYFRMLVHHVPWSPITKWNPRPKCSAPTVYGVHFIWLLQPKGQCTCRTDDAYITGLHFNEAYTYIQVLPFPNAYTRTPQIL